MTTPMAAWAVKKMALIIMMAPTATLWFMAARLTIHPLRWRNKQIQTGTRHGEEIYILICTRTATIQFKTLPNSIQTEAVSVYFDNIAREQKIWLIGRT